MNSGAAPSALNQAKQAVNNGMAGIGSFLGLSKPPPSDAVLPRPPSDTVGGSRFRNMRGRFLSHKKAARVTLKKREARAKTVGTKAQVFHGTAKHTSGGLTRKDLMKTKKGRIVSKRKHAAGKKALRRLKAAGFSAKKGTFKLFRK
jgi:hypothetical protein